MGEFSQPAAAPGGAAAKWDTGTHAHAWPLRAVRPPMHGFTRRERREAGWWCLERSMDRRALGEGLNQGCRNAGRLVDVRQGRWRGLLGRDDKQLFIKGKACELGIGSSRMPRAGCSPPAWPRVRCFQAVPESIWPGPGSALARQRRHTSLGALPQGQIVVGRRSSACSAWPDAGRRALGAGARPGAGHDLGRCLGGRSLSLIHI